MFNRGHLQVPEQVQISLESVDDVDNEGTHTTESVITMIALFIGINHHLILAIIQVSYKN